MHGRYARSPLISQRKPGQLEDVKIDDVAERRSALRLELALNFQKRSHVKIAFSDAISTDYAMQEWPKETSRSICGLL